MGAGILGSKVGKNPPLECKHMKRVENHSATDGAANETAQRPLAGAASPEKFPFFLAAMLVVVASGVRLMGAGNDLWLDEIWPVFVTTQLHSPFDVFTLHHEINHYLNTLWLYFSGFGASAARYHALSLACGMASVVVAALIGWRRGRRAALFAMILIGFSYELVAYSAEARGYSPLVLFSLLSYYVLDLYLERPRWKLAVLYAGCATLGLLSQPMFVSFLGAATIWSLCRLVRSGRRFGQAVLAALACQGVPIAVLAALYLIDMRHIVPGGGSEANSLLCAIGLGFAWALGTPQDHAADFVFSIMALLGAGVGLRILHREGSDKWMFFAAVVFLFPIGLIFARNSDVVYTRHFMVATTFLLVLWSEALALLWTHGRRARCAGMALLAAYLGFNGWHIADWAVHKRGQPGEALRYIAEHTPGTTATIGGEHDFRIGLVVNYYCLSMPEAKRCRYFVSNDCPQSGLDWIITQAESWMPSATPPSELWDKWGNRYQWVKTYRTAPLSGLHWFLYRNGAAM